MEKKKRDWVKIGTLVLCVVLLALNLRQGRRIDELEQDVWNAQNSVMDNIRSMESSLYRRFQKADALVLDWDYTTSVDRETRCLRLEVSLALKEWGEDTAVGLVCSHFWGNGGEGSVPLTSKGNGNFAGTLEIPLTELSGELILDMVIQNGGGSRREDLGSLGQVSELLPVRCYGTGIGGPVYEKDANQSGRFTLFECWAALEGEALALDKVTGQTFRLLKNGKAVMELPGKTEDRLDEYSCGELSTEVQTGDKLTAAFLCKDGYGLNYEFFLREWTVEEGGLSENAPEQDYPRLTWD